MKKKREYIKKANSVSEISESKFLQRIYKNIVAICRVRKKSVDFSNIKKKSVNNALNSLTIFIDSNNNSDNNSNNNQRNNKNITNKELDNSCKIITLLRQTLKRLSSENRVLEIYCLKSNIAIMQYKLQNASIYR